jgi:hypothetical protein
MFIQLYNNVFDIICLSETFLYPDEHFCYDLTGYSFVGNPRDSRGGGVGIYVRDGIACGAVRAVAVSGAESLVVSLDCGSPAGRLSLAVLYRQPGSDAGEFLSDFESLISNLSSSGCASIVMGDLNINTLISTSLSRTYLNIIANYGFNNLINIPTRVTPLTSTCIDHAFTNLESHFVRCGTIHSDVTDHYPIFTEIINLRLLYKPAQTIRIRNFKKLNEENFLHEIHNFDWTNSVTHPSIPCETAFEKFIEEFNNICDKHAPVKIIKLDPSNRKVCKKPWITPGLLRCINKKRRLFRKCQRCPFSSSIKNDYTKYRNKLTTILRETKRDYFSKKAMFASNNNKWHTINTLMCNNSGKKSIPTEVEQDGQIISGDVQIANAFNKFFTSIGPKLNSNFQNQAQSEAIGSYTETHFNLEAVSEATVLEFLNMLDANKAAGIDNVSPKLLKIAKNTNLLSVLTSLINKSINEAVVPSSLKIARVTPVFKKGNPKSCTNYRPISILPILSKLLEKIINSQVLDYFENYSLKITAENQFGFRRKRGTSDAIRTLLDTFYDGLSEKKLTIGVFIDFSKAFDTIDHSLLLKKLAAYGFSTNTLNWFKSYLSNRYQQVVINNEISNKMKILCGVPQGSVLGPTLFIIFINEVNQITKHMYPILYADDTNLFYETTTITEQVIESINEDLDHFYNWALNNKLCINIEKTNFMIIRRPRDPDTPDIELKMGNSILKKVNSTKFLGIILDECLNYSLHIDFVCKKLRSKIGTFFKVSQLLPKEQLITMYYSFINSQILYGLEFYGHSTNYNLNKIFILQKRYIRIIHRVPRLTHTLPLFEQSRILNVYKLFKLKLSVHGFKLFNQLSDSSSTPAHQTRTAHLNIQMPSYKNTYQQKTSTYSSSQTWNSLPPELRSVETLAGFRRAVGGWVLMN